MKRFATASVLLCTLLSPVCAAQYTVTVYDWAKASGINDSGVIVGRGPGMLGTDGTLTQLTVPARTPAGNANAINDSGRAVGFYFSQFGSYKIAAYWDGATRHDLSVPPTTGELFGVNSSGAMCGTVGSTPVAFTASGATITLAGSGGVTTGAARDINNAGRIAGNLGSNVAVWTSAGAVEYVGPAGQANAINNNGIVGGKANGSPFLWTSAGGLQTLAVGSGYNGGEVFAINDQNIAVGSIYLPYSYDVPAGMGSAALWSASGVLTVLPNPTGLTWASALGMNEAGQIVGVAYRKETNGGLYQTAVLWTPAVPEPSSILALLCGVGSLAFWRRRR